jgi:3-hydroxyisobutyrate dehydrogenase
MSTVCSETSRFLAAQCTKHDVVLSMPVSGSVKPAQDGALVILVGTTQASYEIAKPFFDVLGKIAIHVGEAELLVQQNLLLIIY